MDPRGGKLGILVAASPEADGFRHATGLADAAIEAGTEVFFYCIDRAVTGVHDETVKALEKRGMKLHACAYAARKRDFPMDDSVIFSGLSVVSEFMSATDRFVSFT